MTIEHAVSLGIVADDPCATEVHAIVKSTHAVVGDRVIRIDPEPILAGSPDAANRVLAPGREDIAFRRLTDVVVLGAARPSRPVARATVSVAVGSRTCTLHVFGRRRASWSPGGGAVFSEPEPFSAMPLVAGNAYGGWDPRVPLEHGDSLAEVVSRVADHPGVYPRNPQGKGYFVVDEACDEVELPNLESPDDPLTPERFCVGDPRCWWRQPRPAHLGWTFANTFPRIAALRLDPWFPPPTDPRLPEVARGELPADWSRHAEWIDGGCARRFLQQAPPDLQFGDLRPRTPIVVAGMRRDGRRLGFALPEPPRLRLVLDGRTLSERPMLATVTVRPDEGIVTLVWILRSATSGPAFVPGLHGRIPLAVFVDDACVPYIAPPVLSAAFAGRGEQPNLDRGAER